MGGAKIEFPLRGMFYVDEKKLSELKNGGYLKNLPKGDIEVFLGRVASCGDLTQVVQKHYSTFAHIVDKLFLDSWSAQIRKEVLNDMFTVSLMEGTRGKDGYISFLDSTESSFVVDEGLTCFVDFCTEDELEGIKQNIREDLGHGYFVVTVL